MDNKLVQYFILILGTFALSTSAIFVKLSDAPSSIVAFYRLGFTFLMLFPFVFTNKKNLKQVRELTKKQFLIGGASGIFLSLHYLLWFESLRFTSVASSTVIVTLQPVFAFFASALIFKEKFSKQAIFGALISIVGCIIIGWGDFQISGTALIGDLMAFIAAGVITAYFFVGQILRKEIDVVPYSILGYGMSSVILFIYSILTRASFFNYSKLTWWCFLGLAFISTVLGQVIFNWLLKWVSASTVSMSILGESVGTCILAYFVLGEVLTLKQFIGILIILSGLVIYFIDNKKKSDKS
ncbi:DMT family transporter [Fusobacterium sp. MFO224]|uniref:DMT family transporter n=1 Tax=Fusobacterium sp. MFO224 TaxID=3378070 RepID=UPI003851D08D